MPPATDAPAITRSAAIARRCRTCSSTCSSMRTARRRGRSCSTSMPPTIPCTATRKAGSSTAIMPLYVFCGRQLLAAKLRRSNIDAAAGAKDEVARLVAHIRRGWPKVRIVLRADSGFAREELMAWCEASGVDYLFGLARNRRLLEQVATELQPAEAEHKQTGKPARRFKDFTYVTLDSWSRSRRVIGKAEHLDKGANPRFVVTSLNALGVNGKTLYEKVYCARGEMENRIKECQLDLFADRTSTATLSANQLRLWFASLAYVLMTALRRMTLQGTELAKATAGTIRLKLLKLGALVTISVRRVKIAIASASPMKGVFAHAHRRLCFAA